jgi:UDP-glucose 4-epimerase
MELTGKTILVTGGAGFIGSHLVEALLVNPGVHVRVVDNLTTGSRDNLCGALQAGNVEFVHGDIGDPSLLADLLAGVQVVFHLACRGVRHSLGQPLANHDVNATGTLRLLQAAGQAPVQRFVHVSSSEVYGTALWVPMDEDHPCYPETVYGAAKLAGEAYARAHCRTYGLPVVIVRPFNNFGPRSHFEGDAGEVIPRFVARGLAGLPPVIFGDGLQTRDFLYVEDTAYWLCQVAGCDGLVGQTVNLASGKETSVRQLAELVCLEIGRPDLSPAYLPARPGDVRRHLGGMERAVHMLEFTPRTDLREGVRRVIAYLRKRQVEGITPAAAVPEVNWKLAA